MKEKLLTLAVALLAATGAWAQTFTFDNLKYTVTDETTHTVELTGYVTAPEGALTIPATVTNEDTEYSVTSIGSSAFSSCTSLTEVNIPASVTNIGSSAFSSCYYLKAVTIPASVTNIGSSAFSSCYNLKAVTIPASVTNIGSSAFSWCSRLTAVTIPEGVATIGSSAFERCSSLTEVNIPASAINIGSWVFAYCSALTAIHVAEDNTAYSSEDGVLFNKDKTTLVCYPIGKTETTYTVPATVTTIETSAFMKCTALTQVTLPEGITYIGDKAFYNCSALTEMTVLATTPPTVGDVNAFSNVSRDIPVYVPAESLAAYKEAEGWNEFTDLQAISTTGLQTPAMPESIRMQGGMLHNPQQLHLTLYDMQGRQVYSGTAATVSQPAGVYVVRCNGASGKVLF